jgi:putative ABC transport system permease protein
MTPADFRFPRLPKNLLRFLADEDMLASIEEDLGLRYAAVASERGSFRARLFVLRQIISLFFSLILEALTWRMTMLNSYLKIALRQLRRQRGYSLINILGLTVGMACFILIGLWVQDELSFDRFHEKKEHIFRILNLMQNGDYSATPTYALSPALRDLYPEVQESVRAYPHHTSLVKYKDKSFQEFNFMLTDPGFFRMFTFPFIQGDPDTALESRDAVVLTQSMARKYFGDANPIGESLYFDSQKSDFTVTGVIADIPANSTLRFDLAVRVELLGEDRLARWEEWVGPCYVLLRPGQRPEDFEAKISGIYKEYANPDATYSPTLQPLARVHLYENGRPGNVKMVYAFSVIAVFILLMACINFMNLATARSAKRAQEVGMRKVIGALRFQIIRQFLGEALVVAFIALVLAVVLVEALLPQFNAFTAKSLSLLSGASIGIILSLVLATALTGLVAGSYPAFFLSSFQPADTLRRRSGMGSRASGLRKILIVFQFAISVGLIACTLVVSGQLRFIRTMDLGLDREHVLGFRNNPELIKRFDEFKNVLEQTPGILNVTAGAQAPTQVGQNIGIDWEGNPDSDSLQVDYTVVNYDFFAAFDMEILQGRSFSRRFPTDEKEACIINETAARRIGVEDPVGMTIVMNHPAWPVSFRRVRIIGVVKDFHARSVHSAIRPFVFRMYKPWCSYGFIKLAGTRIPETLERIESVFKTYVPDYPFLYMFYDEFYNGQYVNERRLASLFSGFSLLSVLISCLGLFGLASFTAEQKTKEIGIRKVLGATMPGIIRLTTREFIKWVALATLIAWPLSYLVMHSWLRDFAYKIKLGPVVFLLAALLALVISLATVSYHALRAALADPVDSLRYE